jgi:hypothetical protein
VYLEKSEKFFAAIKSVGTFDTGLELPTKGKGKFLY